MFIWILEVVLAKYFSKIQRKTRFLTYFWSKFQKNYKSLLTFVGHHLGHSHQLKEYLREEKSSYFGRKTQLLSLVPMAKGYNTSIWPSSRASLGLPCNFHSIFCTQLFTSDMMPLEKTRIRCSPAIVLTEKITFLGFF